MSNRVQFILKPVGGGGPSTVAIFFTPEGKDKKIEFEFKQKIRYSATELEFAQINSGLMFNMIGPDNAKVDSIDVTTGKSKGIGKLIPPADTVANKDAQILSLLSKLTPEQKDALLQTLSTIANKKAPPVTVDDDPMDAPKDESSMEKPAPMDGDQDGLMEEDEDKV